jgi:hypothetical protein
LNEADSFYRVAAPLSSASNRDSFGAGCCCLQRLHFRQKQRLATPLRSRQPAPWGLSSKLELPDERVGLKTFLDIDA